MTSTSGTRSLSSARHDAGEAGRRRQHQRGRRGEQEAQQDRRVRDPAAGDLDAAHLGDDLAVEQRVEGADEQGEGRDDEQQAAEEAEGDVRPRRASTTGKTTNGSRPSTS